MSDAFRVLVLGGYGHFGTIIARRIAAIDGVTVIIAGRSLAKAESCASRLGAQAAELDLNHADFASRLAALCPNLVISTAGPFQGQDYSVARAAIAARAHYVDIADSRKFVCGVTVLEAAAKAAGVLVISGASSVPALSAAVVDHFVPRFGQVGSIRHGISTSQQVPGSATVAAILACCGKPFQFWHDQAWHSTCSWQAPMQYRFAPPVNPRWMAPCDIPDLELFPTRYKGVGSVQFYAGIESRVLQWGIALLSRAVQKGLIRDAESWARPLRRIAIAMEPFGSGRSAMFLELSGTAREGVRQTYVWELHAENNAGPNIPCMAAVAIARKLAAKQIDKTGAMPCIGLLTLEEYLAELQSLDVRTVERCSVSKLEITRRWVSDMSVVAVSGALRDGTAETHAFHDYAMQLTVSAPACRRPIVFDFSALEYINSVALRTLMHVSKHATAAGTGTAVASPQPLVKEKLEITRFDRVIPVYSSVNEAIAALSALTASSCQRGLQSSR